MNPQFLKLSKPNLEVYLNQYLKPKLATDPCSLEHPQFLHKLSSLDVVKKKKTNHDTRSSEPKWAVVGVRRSWPKSFVKSICLDEHHPLETSDPEKSH